MDDFLRRFTGADYAYTTPLPCMGGDRLRAWRLVASKCLIFASYVLVAAYLWRRAWAIRKGQPTGARWRKLKEGG